MKKIDKIKDNIINKINENNALIRINDFLDTIAKKFMEFNFYTTIIGFYYWLIIYLSLPLFGFYAFFIIPCSMVIYYIFIGIIKKIINRAINFKFITGYIDLGNNLIERVDLIFTNEIKYHEFREKTSKNYTTARTDNLLYLKRKNLNNT